MTDDVRLTDAARPALPAGDYRLIAEQRVTLPAPFVSPPAFAAERRITVDGPHLGLAPGDVAGVYPPAHAAGDFAATLPHVLLGRASLPWEIDPEPPGTGRPWLALLLLDAADLDGAETGDDLTGAGNVTLDAYLHPPDGVIGPRLPADTERRWRDLYGDRECVVVDVPAAAFTTVAPSAAELPWLVHTRDGQAVVLAGRFPTGAPGGRYLAHLVSLEGFTDRLADRGGLPAGTRAVRLLSLARWSFTVAPGGAYFTELVEGLDVGVLRLPGADGADDPVTGGYVPVDYRTRLGERTVAWYRGPLLPVPMRPAPPRAYPAAEAALVYDDRFGLFDVSFAVAWQLGRLLALADRAFTTALLAWVREARRTRHRPEVPDLTPLRAAVGATEDPTGLRRRRHRLPGLLADDAVAALSAAGADPLDAMRYGPGPDDHGRRR
ncbi:hypothetical protein [Dactylosporangium sp. NPDC051541]|uniref:hypothetical protein n=1 Tax=Dactylosporangium sp. NPDC051541 TaxID=3363977 RepID=UPI003792DE11